MSRVRDRSVDERVPLQNSSRGADLRFGRMVGLGQDPGLCLFASGYTRVGVPPRARRTAGVLSRVTDGIPWTVLCVNTQRPLFWLLARDAYASVEELKGCRIGIHPPATACRDVAGYACPPWRS